jgi:hypothetical protein
VILLFKARSKADKDQHDVETALPVLDAGRRSWLQETLKRLVDARRLPGPNHQSIVSLLRGEGPKTVSATPQSTNPATL